MTTPTIEICRVDYTQPQHAQALVFLLDAYARDPMGGGEPLSDICKATLCQRLQQTAGAASWIAWAHPSAPASPSPSDGCQTQTTSSKNNIVPVGLLNSFLGFSTFMAQPLLNVHDIAVLPDWRGHGIGRQLLHTAEAHARVQGCCKLTLEVLEGNHPARVAYQRFGFVDYMLDPATGKALFMHKYL